MEISGEEIFLCVLIWIGGSFIAGFIDVVMEERKRKKETEERDRKAVINRKLLNKYAEGD